MDPTRTSDVVVPTRVTLKQLLTVRRPVFRLARSGRGSGPKRHSRVSGPRPLNRVLQRLAYRVYEMALGGFVPTRGITRRVRETGRKFGQ